MNQDTLNSLKPGEKVVDIQEYYWGENGFRLVFKVTVYICTQKYYLGIFKKKHIKEYTFPFYFAHKEVAQQYLQYFDNFEIEKIEYVPYGFTRYETYKLVIKNSKMYKNYYLTDAYITIATPTSKNNRLNPGGIWNGLVNTDESNSTYVNKDYNMNFTKIFKSEECASKEGTTGKTYSYKLTEI